MKRISLILVFSIATVLLFARQGATQEEGELLTQEEFAVELVKSMRLDAWLPTAALPRDCVDLLETIGIAPLRGWRNKELLEQEDYLVVLAKAHGKEGMLHERAYAVENKNIEIINAKWQEAKQKTGKWPSLENLLNDKTYFPDGAPQSPYGLIYQDVNNDKKVDAHLLSVVHLIRLRAAFSTQ